MREEDEGDEEEPPVPPGLAKLSAPLPALADFLAIDEDLIEVAARGSVGEPPVAPTREELARWVKRLPAADKDDVLVRFLSDEGDLVLRAEVLQRFREATVPEGSAEDEDQAPDHRRTAVGEGCADEEKRRAKAETEGQGEGREGPEGCRAARECTSTTCPGGSPRHGSPSRS